MVRPREEFFNVSCCACECTGTWTLLLHPTPPVTDQPRVVPVCAQEHERYYPTPSHPTGNWSWKSSACVCWRARKMIRLLCLCVHRNMNVITPPHPTPSPESSVCTTESLLCAQVGQNPVETCMRNCFSFVCASESLASSHQVQQDINPKGVVALLTSS